MSVILSLIRVTSLGTFTAGVDGRTASKLCSIFCFLLQFGGWLLSWHLDKVQCYAGHGSGRVGSGRVGSGQVGQDGIGGLVTVYAWASASTERLRYN